MIFRHIKSLANYLHCLTAMQLTRLWWHTAIEGTHNWKFTTSLLILYANFCIFFLLSDILYLRLRSCLPHRRSVSFPLWTWLGYYFQYYY